nr:restriction endonuclease subunit S [Nesterenkonia alkaliphila]
MPKGWTEVPLGKVVQFQNGGTPKKDEPSYWHGTIPWITSADITESNIAVRSHVSHEGVRRSATNVVPAGTTLLVTRTGIGKVAAAPFDLAFSQDITAIHSSTEVVPEYLRAFLRSQSEYFANNARGATIKGITRRIVETLRIPLPPLEEQRRIATILDRVTAIQDAADRYSHILRDNRRAAFLKVLADSPVSHLPVEAVSAAIIDCPHSTPRWQESGVTCLRTTNLGYGEWNWDDHRFVDEAQHAERTKRADLLPGDIVLSREGTVGVMAMVTPGMKASLGQRLVQVRPSDEINGEYLMEALMYELHPTRVEHRMIGATAKRINVKALKNLQLPVPPREAQDHFAALATQTRHIQTHVDARLTTLRRLTQSLQSRAFRGDL